MSSMHPFDRCESHRDEHTSLERDRAAWQQHLWSCGSCRDEALALRGLERATKGAETPGLSADFGARLFARIQLEDATPRLSGTVRLWLAAYWITTGILSVYIALRTQALTLESGLDTFAALVLVWGLWQVIPSRAVRRAVALLRG